MVSDRPCVSTMTRRGLLSTVVAGALTAILAACGEGEATKPAAPILSTPGATTTSGTPVAVVPTVAATPQGTGVGAASSATSGGSATSPPAPITAIGMPQPNQFKGQTLTMLSRQEYFKEVDRSFDVALADFAKTAGCTIENTHVNFESGTVVAKQDAAVKSGNVEDMACFVGFVTQLHQLGDLLPVTDVVKELEAAYGPAEDIIRNALFLDGEWWGIPYYSNASGWFLRKDWLAEKGIKPAEIKTFEQARDAALAISNPSRNRFGWGNTMNGGDGNANIQDIIHAYGSSVASDDGTKVVFDSPATLEAVTFMADIYTNPKYKNMLPPGVNGWTPTGNNEAWLAGTIGITWNAYTMYAQSKDQKNPVYEQTLTVPGFLGPGSDRVVRTGGWGAFVLFKGAKNPALAKAVAKYMVAGKPLKDVVALSAGLIMPAYKNLWDADPFYATGDPIFPTIRSIVQQPLPIKLKTGFNYPQTPSAGNDLVVNSFIMPDMMSEIILNGVKPAEAIKTATGRMVKAFEQVGLKQ